MRIHSDTLSAMHIIHAVNGLNDPAVRVAEISKHGSRSRRQSFDLFLTGHGRTGGQWGNTSDLPTASWDDWGQVLAALYAIDPDLTLKPYPTVEDFELITWGRFPLGDKPAHHNHRWDFDGTTATGRRMFTCKGTKVIHCTARMSLAPIQRGNYS